MPQPLRFFEVVEPTDRKGRISGKTGRLCGSSGSHPSVRCPLDARVHPWAYITPWTSL